MSIASFYYQMALKTSASLFIFSCDIIGSKEKLRTCRPFLKEKNRPLTLKGDQGIIGKELKCEDFPATHGHLKVRLHHLIWKKNEVIVLLRRRISFSGVHVTSLFFVVCHQIYKIPTTCSNERGFRSSNNSEKAEKTVLIYKGQFSSRTKWVRHRVFLKFHFSHICTFSELFSRGK